MYPLLGSSYRTRRRLSDDATGKTCRPVGRLLRAEIYDFRRFGSHRLQLFFYSTFWLMAEFQTSRFSQFRARANRCLHVGFFRGISILPNIMLFDSYIGIVFDRIKTEELISIIYYTNTKRHNLLWQIESYSILIITVL